MICDPYMKIISKQKVLSFVCALGALSPYSQCCHIMLFYLH